MCWSKWFKPKVKPPEEAPLAIPHPEEPQDNSGRLVDLEAVRAAWIKEWNVPAGGSPLLRVDLAFDPNSHYPAYTLGRKIFFKPSWALPGVLAHEMAHVVYANLTAIELQEFAGDFRNALVTDPLTRLLDAQNSYMNVSLVEGFAEIYRYLGDEMPGYLKRYYPGLLEV